MSTNIPSAEEIKALFGGLTHAQVVALAANTGVPFTTLWKIKSGETANPRIETVRQFMPALVGVIGSKPEAEAA